MSEVARPTQKTNPITHDWRHLDVGKPDPTQPNIEQKVSK